MIYGEGPIRGELEGLRASLDLEDCVDLPGCILQDDLVQRFAQADVFGLACKVLKNGDRDGLPNVLIEALAMGVPVVSTHISGVPELVEDGVQGVLVPPGDPQAFADALARLLSDPATQRSMSRAGRARVVEEFDTRRNTRRVLELFESLDGVGPVSRHDAEDVRPASAPAPV